MREQDQQRDARAGRPRPRPAAPRDAERRSSQPGQPGLLRVQRAAGNGAASRLVQRRAEPAQERDIAPVVVQRDAKVGFEFEVGWGVKQAVRTEEHELQEAEEIHALEEQQEAAETGITERVEEQKAGKLQEMGMWDLLFRATDEYQTYRRKRDAFARRGAIRRKLGSAPTPPDAGVVDLSDEPLTEANTPAEGDEEREDARLLSWLEHHFPQSTVQQRVGVARMAGAEGGGRYRIIPPIDLTAGITRQSVMNKQDRNVLEREREAGFINIGKAEEIMDAPGGGDWALTADMNSGESELEWVTEPLTSPEQVGAAMDQIVAMAQALEGAASLDMIPMFFLQEAGLGQFTAKYAEEQVFVLPEGEMVGAPQLTGDFDLGQMIGLMRTVMAGTEGSGKLVEKMGGSDRDALGLAMDAAERVRTQDVNGKGGSEQLVGLLALMLNYVYVGRDSLNNSKGIATGFMSRSDFSHNFGLLPEHERDWFVEDPTRLSALVGTITGLDMGTNVFAKGFKTREADTEVHTVDVTRAQWFEGIVEGTDLLTHAANDLIHKSLGGLGDVNAKRRGEDEEEIEAVIVELRRMADGLKTSEWKALALRGFDVAARVAD